MTTTTRIDVRASGDRPNCQLTTGLLSPRRLATTDGTVRIALVAAQALLLGGDRMDIEVTVDGPLRVDIVEIAGTVAYDMRGADASWRTTVSLRHGAQMTWYGEPFVVSAGADVDRTTQLNLQAGCTAALREALVFGRSGETGGTLRTRSAVTVDGRPVLTEDLDLAPGHRTGWTSLRGARCLDSITTAGFRLPDGPGVLQCEAEASLARSLTDALHHSTMPGTWAEAVRPTNPATPSAAEQTVPNPRPAPAASRPR